MKDMQDIFDNCLEKFFDTVDSVFSFRSITSGALAASLITSPANAGCEHIRFKDQLSVFDGYPAASEQYDIDTVKREVCVALKPMVQTLIADPDNFCVHIDEDEQQSLWLKFPSGAALDISGDYSSEAMRPVYDWKYKVCHGRAGPMA